MNCPEPGARGSDGMGDVCSAGLMQRLVAGVLLALAVMGGSLARAAEIAPDSTTLFYNAHVFTA